MKVNLPKEKFFFFKKGEQLLKIAQSTALSQNPKDWSVSVLIVSTLILFATTIFLLFSLFSFRNLPPQIPLFYSKPWGQDQLAAPAFLFIPLLIALVFVSINQVLSSWLKNPFVAKLFLLGASLASLLASITIIRILFLANF